MLFKINALYKKLVGRWAFYKTGMSSEIIDSIYCHSRIRNKISKLLLYWNSPHQPCVNKRQLHGLYTSHKLSGPQVYIYSRSGNIYAAKFAALTKLKNEGRAYKDLAQKLPRCIHIPQLRIVSHKNSTFAVSKYIQAKRTINISEAKSVISALIKTTNKQLKNGVIYSTSHGDFSVYNCFVCGEKNNIAIIDWEEYGERPLGFDFFYFVLSYYRHKLSTWWFLIPEKCKLYLGRRYLKSFLEFHIPPDAIGIQIKFILQDDRYRHLLAK